MNKFPWYWYVMCIMALYIIFLKSCGNSCPAVPATKIVKSDTSYDKQKLIVNETPKAVVHTKWDTAFLPATNLDTAGIVADYMEKRSIVQVIPVKYGIITIRDTLYQNKISDRQVVFDMKMPVITNTTMIIPKNQVFAGIDLGSNGSFIALGGTLVLKTKLNKLYWLGASYTSQSQFYYHVGAAFLIHL